LCRTDSGGHCFIPGVPAGGYAVSVRAVGFQKSGLRTIDVSGHRFAWAKMVVSSLYAQDARQVARLRGRAVDQSGKPVPGASVRMTGVGDDRCTVSDPTGSFVFQWVPSVSYQVSLSEPRFVTLRLGGRRLHEGENELGPVRLSRAGEYNADNRDGCVPPER
jgi:hypothetical protein